MTDEYVADKVAFETDEDRGYKAKATYLKDPHKGDAVIEIFRDGQVVRRFLFPAYKVWNIAAHFSEIVDSEIEKNDDGYRLAAWTGIGPL